MTSNAPSASEPARVRKRRVRLGLILGSVLGGVVVLLLAAAAAIYAERRLIAATLVQRYLASYGIESEIAFDSLAWGGFLARVRAGPRDAPDFTADGVDVTLIYPDTSSLAARVTPQVTAVRLIRPQVRVGYDGKMLTFGSLQGLVDDILAMDSGAAGPAIQIDDGRLSLTTPYGALNVRADATVEDNRLSRLDAVVERTALKYESLVADITGGSVSAAMDGDAVNAKFSLTLASLVQAGRSARGIELKSDIGGLKWSESAGAYSFTLDTVALDIGAGAADAPEVSADRATARAIFQTVAGRWADGQLRLQGRGEVSEEFAAFKTGDWEAALLKMQTSLSSFTFEVSTARWSSDATAHVVLDATSARYPVPGGAVALASLRSEFDGVARHNSSETVATLKGTLAANGSLPQQIALRSLNADFDGQVAGDGSGRIFVSSLTASTGLPRARAQTLARDILGSGSEEALASAVADAVQAVTIRLRNANLAMSGGALTVTARVPVVLEGAQGANFTLSPRGAAPILRRAGAQTSGAFDLNVRGGGLPQARLGVPAYRYRVERAETVLDADAEFAVALDYGAFRGVDVSGAGKLQMADDRLRFDAPACADLALASYTEGGADLLRNLRTRVCGAALQVAGGRMQLDLANCADVSFDAFLSGGADQLREAKARLCGVPASPLLVSQSSGWRIDARLSEATARLVAGNVRAAEGAARVQLAGDASAIRSSAIALDRASLVDLEPTPRFQPLSASGTLSASGEDWSGDIAFSLAERRLASVALKHRLSSGAGEAAIEVRGLAFEPNAFQPADIAPFLSAFGSRLRGVADFSGRFAWSADGMTSEGRLTLPGMDLQSPLGAVRQLKTEIAFSSLLPVAIRPSQSVTAQRIDVMVPIEQVSATFTYAPEALRIEAAAATVAGGRATLDPMSLSFAPGATSAGTVRLQNINIQPLIEIAGLADRMNVEARIDGAVPFTLGPDGVRFADGRIAANAPGRLSIKREALTGSVGLGGGTEAPPNAVQDFAYQALENLAFDRLEGVVNSQPMGRLGVLFRLAGRNDPPQAAEARVGVVDLLRGRAFDRPLPLPKGTPIDLTLDTSVNLDELLESYLNRNSAAAAAMN